MPPEPSLTVTYLQGCFKSFMGNGIKRQICFDAKRTWNSCIVVFHYGCFPDTFWRPLGCSIPPSANINHASVLSVTSLGTWCHSHSVDPSHTRQIHLPQLQLQAIHFLVPKSLLAGASLLPGFSAEIPSQTVWQSTLASTYLLPCFCITGKQDSTCFLHLLSGF